MAKIGEINRKSVKKKTNQGKGTNSKFTTKNRRKMKKKGK